MSHQNDFLIDPFEYIGPDLMNGETEDEWEPRPDQEYYGSIPEGVTIDLLVEIMAEGLLKYYLDAKPYVQDLDMEYLLFVLDSWFEHDFAGQNQFDHLFLKNEESVDQFFDRVEESLQTKLDCYIKRQTS